MTLSIGDYLLIKRNGILVTGEAYHEFEAERVDYTPELDHPGEVLYTVKLKMIE